MSKDDRSGSSWSRGGFWIPLILLSVIGGGIFGLSSGGKDESLQLGIEDRLTELADGVRVEVSWRRVTLSGVVGSEETRDRALQEAISFPGVRRISDRMRVVPPRLLPPRFSLVILEDGRLSLEGSLNEQDNLIWENAASLVGGIAYSDLRVDSRMQEMGDSGILAGALSDRMRIPGLAIDLVPGKISLDGELPDVETQAQVVAVFREKLPEAWQLVDTTSVDEQRAEAAADNQDLARLLENLRIEFETSSYQLTSKSEAVLDTIASFLASRPHLRLEIAAADEISRSGSGKRRADAMYMSLMGRGISSTSLTSRELGQQAPETGVARFRVYPR